MYLNLKKLLHKGEAFVLEKNYPLDVIPANLRKLFIDENSGLEMKLPGQDYY